MLAQHLVHHEGHAPDLVPLHAGHRIEVHAQLGGGLRLFATAGAFLPPALQQAWEDIGVIVLQGYGATETAAGSCTTMDDHPLGCVGWPPKPVEMRIAADDRPIIYLYFQRNFLVSTPKVAGIAFYADGLPRLKTAGFTA